MKENMTVNRLFLRGIVVSFFLCLAASLAFGQDNRTWVSAAAGVTDPGTCAASNICTRSAPCATFACALQATNPGGEIDVLDSGDFGPLNGANSIAKSVSIVADGVVAGIQKTTSSDAIDVNAGSADVVVLRGLTIDGLSGANDGIRLSAGGVLHIEGCTINGPPAGVGIRIIPVSGQSRVFINDTIVRDGDTGILFEPLGSGTVTASLDNVRVENNGSGGGVVAYPNATASVRDSVVAGSGSSGFTAFSLPGMPAVINLESSIASGNATGVSADGTNATINMSNVTVVKNTTGLKTATGGHIVSFGNNKITDNTTNGSPTKTIAQH
jgi:hypothetical protein